MALIGYARVSTRSQRDDSQVDELEAAGCERIYRDVATGRHADRPELEKCRAYLREGDVFTITRLSRAMRSLKHMLNLASELEGGHVGLKVLKQQIDTTTPAGRLVFHIMAAIDEFQRELIVEGTVEGLAAARARGHVGGRPPSLAGKRLERALDLYDQRVLTVAEVAGSVGVSRQTIYRALEARSAGDRAADDVVMQH
jgi:DNA invertase Pin-like site-specific DNA recombinase